MLDNLKTNLRTAIKKIVNSSGIDEELIKELQKWYDEGSGYHTITLPNGYKLNGRYDMLKVLDQYKIPENLDGKTVLDVGPGTGFFSFEFAKRGANVLAIDKYDKGWNKKLAKIMGPNVKFRKFDINDLDASFGQFDIVFCSHLLQHVPDIFGCIKKIKSVTKEKAIIATQLTYNLELDKIPGAMEFYGLKYYESPVKSDYLSYWLITSSAFKKMAETAGFNYVEEVSKFSFPSEPDPPKKVFVGEHTVRTSVHHCKI